ncbi:MAG: hypothetical protein R3C52_01090 [Hyphomonadaceae bacterium]
MQAKIRAGRVWGKRAVLSASAAALLLGASWADPPPPSLPPPLGPLLNDVLADGSLDAEEKQRLVALETASAPVTLSVAGAPTTFAPPDTADRALLAFLIGPSNLREHWLGPQEKMRVFVRASMASPALRDMLERYAANEFLTAWRSSRMSNDYKPVRQLLADYMEALKPLEEPHPDEYRAGQALAYDAMQRVNVFVGLAVPGWIYSWLKPDRAAGEAQE